MLDNRSLHLKSSHGFGILPTYTWWSFLFFFLSKFQTKVNHRLSSTTIFWLSSKLVTKRIRLLVFYFFQGYLLHSYRFRICEEYITIRVILFHKWCFDKTIEKFIGYWSRVYTPYIKPPSRIVIKRGKYLRLNHESISIRLLLSIYVFHAYPFIIYFLIFWYFALYENIWFLLLKLIWIEATWHMKGLKF